MLGLYVHIPFCIRKCNYCDFLSFPAQEEAQERYIQALVEEIKLYGRSENLRLASLYIGGGTPTLLTEKLFIQLFSALQANFNLANNCEITVEANPGTLSFTKIRLLKELGVNRISLGVQSLQKTELLAMGRIHSATDVNQAVEMFHKAGIENYSFDFIGGLPEQTAAVLLDSLRRAIQFEPKHISLYGLKLEEQTYWDRLERENKLELPDEDTTADIMQTAREFLQTEGYKRYEISNYARKNYESRHNLRYWLNEHYIGIGLGAASYYLDERYNNESDMDKYCSYLQQQVFPIAFREKITLEIEQAETAFLGLRMIAGVKLARFKQRFGKEITEVFSETLEKHLSFGLLELTPTHLRLTPRGLEIANEVMQDFLP